MFVLDTDKLTSLLRGHERVTARRAQVTEEVALSAVTRIEVLQGRFAAMLKAENGSFRFCYNVHSPTHGESA